MTASNPSLAVILRLRKKSFTAVLLLSFLTNTKFYNSLFFSFAGLLYLSLYAAGKMHLFDRRGHAVKAWIAVTPLIGATLIAVSRTSMCLDTTVS